MNLQEKLNEILKRAIATQNQQNQSENEDEFGDKMENVKIETKTQNAENDATKTQNTASISQNDEAKTEIVSINTDPNNAPIHSNTNPKTLDELNKYLDEVERDYVAKDTVADLPEYLDLDEKTFEETSEEEIEKQAKAEADAKYEAMKNEAEKELDQKVSGVESQKKTAEETALDLQSETNMQFDKAREIASNDALRRGLARSSIVLLELSQIEEARADELLDIQKNLLDSLAGFETDLQNLATDHEKAMRELDLAKAAEISANIQKKMESLEKTRNEVLEYNNKVKELEHKYNISIDEAREKLVEQNKEETAKLNKNIEEAKKNEQIALLTNYYAQFGKERALAELAKDTSIAQKVGMDVYYIVYRNVLSRNF